MTTAAWRTGAVLGVASAGAGLAASELASGILHQRVSPVVAVAECVIQLTPGQIIESVISVVGRNDKPLLIGLTLFGLALVSAITGYVALRSLAIAETIFVVMGVVLVFAVRSRLTPSTATYIPALVGVVVAVVLLAFLTPYARRGLADESDPPTYPGAERSRREFMKYAAIVSVAAVTLGATGRLLAHGRAALEAARRRLRLPVSSPRQPQGVDLGVSGVTKWVTDQEDFYRIDTALSIPQILPADWELRIHGRVDTELVVSYQDLVDRGLTEYWLTLCCVSNEVGGDLISNAWWSGVPIADLLAEAGVQDGADAVLSTSDDGWTCGTPLTALTDDRNALLAVAMNGEPLTPEHGFPVRMVVPGLYGYVSATKWVVDLEVTSFDDFSAFWTDNGWSEQGPVKTQSRIDVPGDGANLDAGDVAIGGIAWAQHTGISAVEVRIDDGDWQPAKLGVDETIDSWRQWSLVWAAEPGDHSIQVRATDASGYTQTEELADVVPDGATGWHTIEVNVD